MKIRKKASNMANGEILDNLERDINQALVNKKLSEDKRMMFRMMQTFVVYLKDDHKSVKDMAPKVEALWGCKEQADKDSRENKKMVLSPLFNILITLGVSTIFNALIFYFTYERVLAMVAK
jgi:hypothetical protein